MVKKPIPKRAIHQLLTYQNPTDYVELQQLALDFKNDTNYFFSRYAGLKSLGRLSFRTIRDQDLSKNKQLKTQLHLTGHYSQRCLNSAVGNIKSQWSNLFRVAKTKIRDNSNLTESEKEFLYIICNSHALADVVLNTSKPFKFLLKKKIFDKWKERKRELDESRERYVRSYFRRLTRRLKGKIPYTTKTNRIKADSTLYRYCKDAFSIARPATSDKKGRIVLKPMTNQKFKSEGNFDVTPEGLVGTYPVKIKRHFLPKEYTGKAADKGYTDLLTTTTGAYGKGYSQKVRPYVTKAREKMKNRQPYWALYYTYKKIGTPKALAKAERIKENNLGYKKLNKQQHRFEAVKKSLINQAVNEWFKAEPAKQYILEDLTWNSTKKIKRSKVMEHELSQWDKGYLQERIEFKAYAQHSKITLVNPAYTSQICHKCQHFGERNGKTFTCDHCQTTMDADRNAAYNIECRANDEEITTFTNYKKVKEILENRIAN